MTTQTTILANHAIYSNYPTYDNYKDSGVDWLGEIPEDWELVKLKYLVEIRKRIIGHEGVDVLSITQKGIKVKDIKSGEGQLAMDYSKYQIVNKGDFAMNHMDLLTGYVDKSQFDGVVSPDYRVFTNESSDLNDDYLLKIFQMGYTQKIFFKYGQGVSMLGRWRFPADNFNLFLIPIPSKDEQNKIINFLDQKTAQIDQAIALKQQQIDKLNEYKQIVIQNAVTKGLNPNAPMKNSGVDWLGQIPEGWQSINLRNLLNEVSIKNNPNMPLLSITREKGVILRDVEDDSNHNFIPDDLSNYKLLKKGQFGMNKMKAWQGSYGIANHTGIVSPAYYTFDLHNKVESRFFHLAIRTKAYVGAFYSASDGVRIGQWDLNKTRMANIPFIFPSKETQTKIADFLDQKTAQIDQAIALKQQQIDKLNEYKTVLINQTVTGKIKVA